MSDDTTNGSKGADETSEEPTSVSSEAGESAPAGEDHPTTVTPVAADHPTTVTPVAADHPTTVTPVAAEHPTTVTPVAGETGTTVEPTPVAAPPLPPPPAAAAAETAGAGAAAVPPPVAPPQAYPESAAAPAYGAYPAAYQGSTYPGGYQAAPGYPVGYQPGYAVPQVPQTSNNAVVALCLAIIGWFACPLVLAIIALVFAHKASNEIKASNGWLTGSGIVLSARIIAWLNIAFAVIGFLLMAAFFVWGMASGAFDPSYDPGTFDVPEPSSPWGT